MKIGIIGTGAYGIAIALNLLKNNCDITMWTESDNLYEQYLQQGKIPSIIPEVDNQSSIKLTRSYEETVKDASIIFLASTAAYIHSICLEIKDLIKEDTIICIASKGIENNSCSFLSTIVENTLPNHPVTLISGPSFAIDMANNNPVGLSLASNNKNASKIIKDCLENNNLKLRETNDLIGVQLCGSIKNVIAIASGIIAGLGYPESTQSFLITESIHDIKELIDALGGNPKTVLSFAGLGDLLLTCTSTKSRNFSFGYTIGKTKSKEQIEDYLKNNTVEGYYTLKSIYQLITNKQIEMPIIDKIYSIVMNNEDPQNLLSFLIEKE